MFARVTTYELEEGRAAESITAFEPAIERIRTLDGLVEAYFLVERDGRSRDHDDALGVARTRWSGAGWQRRAPRIDAAREAGAEIASTYELEVGVHTSLQAPETALSGQAAAS